MRAVALLWMLCLPQFLTLRPQAAEASRPIACLGRFMPSNEVVQVAGTYSVQGPAILSELLVRRGDWVRRGQRLAVLHTYALNEAALRQAEADVALAAAQLAEVKAGAKPGDIAAQEAVVVRSKAEIALAEQELERNKPLLESKTISPSDFDRAALDLKVKQANLAQAQAQLESIREVREVNVQSAEARLRLMEAARDRARVELELSVVKSPADGAVLDILSRPGELLTHPIVELGDTAHMMVEAEVYVDDISRVRVGAKADITCDAFTETLGGTVAEIELIAADSTVANPDPAAFSDKRVIKVWISLAEGKRAGGLTRSQVRVLITP